MNLLTDAYDNLIDPACPCGWFRIGHHSGGLLEEEVAEIRILSDKTNNNSTVCSSESQKPKQSKKNIGGRRKRADIVRTVFCNPKLLHACNNVQVECVAYGEEPVLNRRRTDMWKAYDANKKHKEVVVAVEATHISHLDVCIRRGFFADKVATPFVTGSNFVGIVHNGALPQGIRVAALTRTGGNARYISVKPEALIQVPRRFASCEVACIISSYLPALQALYHGYTKNIREEFKESLKSKRILLTEGMSMVEIEALVQLASAAGALSIHVVCMPKYHDYIQDHYVKVSPLDACVEDWLPVAEGKMDVIIDYDYSRKRRDISSALSPDGRLVWFAHSKKKFLWDYQKYLDHASLFSLNHSSIYNPYESWTLHREESKVRVAF